MAMKDMSLSIQEKKEQAEPTMITDQADYPYGLRIDLDPKSVEKLGLESIPKLNDTMTLVAKVEVVNISSQKGEDDIRKPSITLQITDMSLEAGAKKEESSDGRSTASVLFGG